MLKKFSKMLKTLLGVKTKPAVASSKTAAKEPKSQIKQSSIPFPHENARGTHKPRRKPHRKETREEYRLRHEKRALQLQENEPPKEIIPQVPWNDSEFKVPVVDGKTRFHDLEIPKEILHAVFDLGFEYCTQIQAETLPRALTSEDVTAQAQTGTGKTAAFLITIFNHILKNPVEKKSKRGTPRALILAPTRELVLQIEKDARLLGKYTPCKILSLVGGMDYIKQQKILHQESIDILICTPGRLLDFMSKRIVDLQRVEILIIDEADRMLDMGFIPSVKKIVLSTPQKAKRQTMFFTATMTTDVKRLAESWTRQALEITVQPEDITLDSIEQITYITTVEEKPTLLYNLIMQRKLERVLIFVNRRDDARKLKETLDIYGISCVLLSGEVDQRQRIKRLENFREGKARVLVATDVASRGIHVDAISHVINFNMPQDVEEYVHRIGRTGRAGASGISINFADEFDSHELSKLEEFLGKKIECTFPEDNLLTPIPELYLNAKPTKESPKQYKKKYPSRKNSGPRNRSDRK
ncbi:MAG: ATP-dependent RNA helicase RhlB [Ignavibacteriae bacterium HGW-Ignavibacteriae-2]|nr:MAG: ATP-dependent RNA helicase RhlB [Ignavibacteriae bacterium HGW-Ignavibacteriae-2]